MDTSYGRVALLVLSTIGFMSCKKGEAAPVSDQPADPCADATYKHPDPPFCLKHAPGIQFDETVVVGKETRVRFKGPEGKAGYTISWGGYATLADAEPFIKSMLEDPKNERKGGGDVPNRKNAKYYWVGYEGDLGQAEVFLQAKDKVFVCYINALDDQIKALVDACLTLYSPA